jgi:hypothetical protein
MVDIGQARESRHDEHICLNRLAPDHLNAKLMKAGERGLKLNLRGCGGPRGGKGVGYSSVSHGRDLRLRTDPLGAESSHDVFRDKELNLALVNGCRVEVEGHDGRSAGAFDAFVVQNDGVSAVGALRLGQPASSEETEKIGYQNQEEEDPDSALELPPAALEIEVLSDGDVAGFRD